MLIMYFNNNKNLKNNLIKLFSIKNLVFSFFINYIMFIRKTYIFYII
jgi:hypothetical protein